MVTGLASDSNYREGADNSIASVDVQQNALQLNEYDNSAADEVRYSREMWEGAYEKALGIARTVADRVGGAEMSGYRAWWWYLVSVAADHVKDHQVAVEALERSMGTGINGAWLYRVLKKLRVSSVACPVSDTRSEELWNAISDWGWTGPAFAAKMQEMRSFLSSLAHLDAHQGLELLGRCYGLRTIRPTTPGAVDVAWLDIERGLAVEAKTEKKSDSFLFKKDLQEAKGHPEWVRHFEKLDPTYPIAVSILSPATALDDAAKPFAADLYLASPQAVLQLAEASIKVVTELRTIFLGREFPQARSEFEQKMLLGNLTWKAIEETFLSTKLG